MMSADIEMQSAAQRQAQRLNELQDEEESSLIGNENGQSRRSSAGSSLDRLAVGGLTSSPGSLSNDLAVCNRAWNRLSCPTRSVLLLVFGTLLMLATYQFGMGEGKREQENDNAKHAGDSSPGSWQLFAGVNDKKDDVGKPSKEENYYGGNYSDSDREELLNMISPAKHPTFTREVLVNTRARAMELVGTLDYYYGGINQAHNMLVNSWQAQWLLDSETTYEDLIGDNYASDDDDDSIDDNHRRARSGKATKRKKNKNSDTNMVNENGGNADEEVDETNRKEEANEEEETEDDSKEETDGSEINDEKKKNKKNNKKKGVKEGKVLNDPNVMSPEELKQHHNYKRKRTKKLVETMARAILNPDQHKFIIGTIGSSVAAGHDNCHYDSYESQLERTLAPIFSAANMWTIVQNAGEGGGCGDTHQNQVFCITHNVSPDVDIIHYSWTYFEHERPEEQREQLIRWAQRMERRPMVHHLVARGKKNTCEGDSEPNVILDRVYAPYGYNAFCIQTGLYFGGHDYDTENENGLNRFGYQKQGDGYHNTTRYGEELPDDDPRKASLGTVYRNWHPGPLGFQIASDAFAYVYTKGLLMALDAIEKDMDNRVNLMDRWFDKDRRLSSVEREESGNSRKLNKASQNSHPTIHRQLYHLPPLESLPEPRFCDPRYCSTHHPPFCLNYEKPTYGTPGIITKNQAHWIISHEDNKWNYMVGKVDTAIIKAKHDEKWEQKCAHLDACGGISAEDSRNGPLVYELPSSDMTAGLVFVCGCCGKNVGDFMFLNNQNVTFKLNGRELDKSKMDVYPNPKCVRLLGNFGDDGYHKEDKMLLTVEMADQPPDLPYEGKPFVKISHVVAL